MKIFVVFGAKSDENVYGPLVKALQERNHQVTCEVISAHRQPDRLKEALATLDYQVVVAGAGLSAHLPGVVASQVYAPVIGIPVNGAFGGLDALCSVFQMPFGVPVAAYFSHEGRGGRAEWKDLLAFLESYGNKEKEAQGRLRVVPIVAPRNRKLLEEPEIKKEKDKAILLAQAFGWDLVWVDRPLPGELNVILVGEKEDIDHHHLSIHVPCLTSEQKNRPETLVDPLYSWMKEGGTWVGANNLGNALVMAAHLFPKGKNQNHDLKDTLRLIREKKLPLDGGEKQTAAGELPPILYRGSVKNVRGLKGDPVYYFEFSDRYSVFDWGEMPDSLQSKGEALATMADIFFRELGKKETWKNWPIKGNTTFLSSPLYPFAEVLSRLSSHGLYHHSLGLFDQNGREVPPGHPSPLLKVKSVKVDPPKEGRNKEGAITWDYERYEEKRVQHLVPLEVIFRFGMPTGSSLKKRIQNETYRKELGLSLIPSEGDYFDFPIIEFSTKLEPTDRYVNYAEAQKVAGLSRGEFGRLYAMAVLVSLRLKDIFADTGLELWDGKLEFAFKEGERGEHDRDFFLVDAIGPDELRLLKDGVQLSKEILRQHYHQSPWANVLDKAKAEATRRGILDWQELCEKEFHQKPSPLPAKVKKTAEEVYQCVANLLSEHFYGKKIFSQTSTLNQLVEELKK